MRSAVTGYTQGCEEMARRREREKKDEDKRVDRGNAEGGRVRGERAKGGRVVKSKRGELVSVV